jgi:hypothetical protein
MYESNNFNFKILQAKPAIHVATKEKEDNIGYFYPLSAYVS